MDNNRQLLVSVLKAPSLCEALSSRQWELLVRQARSSNLLAHLYHTTRGFSSNVPVEALAHMEAAEVVSRHQRNAVLNEIHLLKAIMDEVGTRLVLLKGSAYIAAGLAVANGRLLSDIDILINKNLLPQAEKALALNGWFSIHHDRYDDRYYRKWMHEIPPLVQVKRQTNLDVHHTILPPTARYKPDPDKLFNQLTATSQQGVFTLSPQDIVIHSATHLFHEGEFNHGLRDLVDISELIKEFSQDNPDFCENLPARARELDLSRPLFYAFRYAISILDAPISETAYKMASVEKPNGLTLAFMDFIFDRALTPHHSSCNKTLSGLSRWILYIRSHYLRMPTHLLIPHLIRKAWKRRIKKPHDENRMEAHKVEEL
ncbi:MAG: nucleotidyltransferase family protein [Porticoccaceae bacterium]|nr:nucleotidyltransferase family protein [Pseudomonadales bacterium]MCP5172706.1 nucleotidyltransferase family protein [Pseudomonadales bacterium]MCP5302180.1 nucleotidyltransferase family protein [Pseudomonadales bacterium]